jgi:hypothetical protein
LPDAITVQDSQGATLTFNGVTLGYYVSISPSWSVSSSHETTSKDSPILGRGTDARILRQYNVSSVEPGQIAVNFIGNSDLDWNSIGVTGYLKVSWPGGSISGDGFMTDIQGDISAGELVRWSLTFKFSGYN